MPKEDIDIIILQLMIVKFQIQISDEVKMKI